MARTRLAVVTGASSGIGYELAKFAAEDGCNLIVAADEAAIGDRDVDLFCTNAGRTLEHTFADQDWSDVKRLIDLNVLQITTTLHRVLRGAGRMEVQAPSA